MSCLVFVTKQKLFKYFPDEVDITGQMKMYISQIFDFFSPN